MSVLECTAGKEMDVSVGEFSRVGKACLCWSVQQKREGCLQCRAVHCTYRMGGGYLSQSEQQERKRMSL